MVEGLELGYVGSQIWGAKGEFGPSDLEAMLQGLGCEGPAVQSWRGVSR